MRLLCFDARAAMALGYKTGGRKKGTPNKLTAKAKGIIDQWLTAHATLTGKEGGVLLMEDFLSLDPRDRMRVTAEFVRLVMPRDTAGADDTARDTTTEEMLAALAGEDTSGDNDCTDGDDTESEQG